LNIWFTADTHFGHKKIIEYSKRPFDNIHQMEEFYLDKHNELVKPKDWFFHLGDVAFGRNNIFNKLNGRKHLIKGNHDRNSLIKHLNICWVKDIYDLKIGEGNTVALCHYPILSWSRKIHGSYHFYGHVHNNVSEQLNMPKSVNVGVDIWGFMPVVLEDLLEFADRGEKII